MSTSPWQVGLDAATSTPAPQEAKNDGVANPDALRRDETAVDFVRGFFEADKPVAAICHAPWTLIEAGVVSGRTLTSWPSLRTHLTNAGASWVDEEVVQDEGLMTSRNPGDLPAFCSTFVKVFA